MIKRSGGKYIVLSETTRRKFGTYTTLKAAKRRLQQVEYFKHLKDPKGGRLRRQVQKKSLLK